MAQVVPFVFKAVVGYLAGRVVSEATGNRTLGMVAGALTSYGMSSVMSGAASAGSTAGTATAGDVAANSAGSAAPAAGSSVSAGAATGTGTAAGGSSAINSTSGLNLSNAGNISNTIGGSSSGGAGGASGGLLSKAWGGAKSYAASDAGKKMIAETLVGGVKGYAETKKEQEQIDQIMKFRAEEAEKVRNFQARHDAAVSDPALYRMGQSGERAAGSFLDDKHRGLLSLYEELYSKEKKEE